MSPRSNAPTIRVSPTRPAAMHAGRRRHRMDSGPQRARSQAATFRGSQRPRIPDDHIAGRELPIERPALRRQTRDCWQGHSESRPPRTSSRFDWRTVLTRANRGHASQRAHPSAHQLAPHRTALRRSRVRNMAPTAEDENVAPVGASLRSRSKRHGEAPSS